MKIYEGPMEQKIKLQEFEGSEKVKSGLEHEWDGTVVVIGWGRIDGCTTNSDSSMTAYIDF